MKTQYKCGETLKLYVNNAVIRVRKCNSLYNTVILSVGISQIFPL